MKPPIRSRAPSSRARRALEPALRLEAVFRHVLPRPGRWHPHRSGNRRARGQYRLAGRLDLPENQRTADLSWNVNYAFHSTISGKENVMRLLAGRIRSGAPPSGYFALPFTPQHLDTGKVDAYQEGGQTYYRRQRPAGTSDAEYDADLARTASGSARSIFDADPVQRGRLARRVRPLALWRRARQRQFVRRLARPARSAEHGRVRGRLHGHVRGVPDPQVRGLGVRPAEQYRLGAILEPLLREVQPGRLAEHLYAEEYGSALAGCLWRPACGRAPGAVQYGADPVR